MRLCFDRLQTAIVEIVIVAGHIVVGVDEFHEILLQCTICVVYAIPLLQMT